MADCEYIIVGDTQNYNGCLICVCGESKDRAEETLERMTTRPTENEIRMIEGHTNLRIKEVPKSNCWWNGNLD